ncbi:MAG: hypothetical protein JNL28_10205 [Planctomycetes bacterium]|nr:hypothetical protein [Planctomycetota bacterium]
MAIIEPVVQGPIVAVTDCPIFSGPLKSERLGATLGVDLGSQDMALAVSRINRMPRASVVVTTAARHIIRISKGGEKIEAIAVYGSKADPTLHPSFREITENLRDLRNKWFSKAKLCLILDEPRLEDSELRHVLGIYDRVYLRMEWGTAKTFAAMTGRKSTEFGGYLDNLSHIEHLVVQARFQRGDVDNSTDAEVKAWIKKIGELKPREIAILGGDAKGSAKKGKVATKTRLNEIAADVTEKTGIPANVVTGDSLLA